MSKLLLTVILILSGLLSYGQNDLPADATKLTMADMQKLARMSPKEQEAYRQRALKHAEDQLKKVARAGNVLIDENLLPGTKLEPPKKDLQRLSAIPTQVFSKSELISYGQKLEDKLRSIAGASVVQKLDKLVSGKSASEIRNAAVGGWYAGDPQGSLLLAMKAARQEPGNILNWNNLAALLNLSRLEHLSIPVLRSCLMEKPGNSMLLNNLGQAYMGLGDLEKAEEYLQQSVTADKSNPEANHSLALIHVYKNEHEKAREYFRRELEVAQRRSTLAQLVKSGNREHINIAELRKRKIQRDGVDKRNFFEEVALGKFTIPDLPLRSDDLKKFQAEEKPFEQSVVNELHFWSNAGQLNSEQLAAEGRKYAGIYHDLVNELISDLGKTYHPLIVLLEDDDIAHIKQMKVDFYKKLSDAKCPSPPSVPGGGEDLIRAYERKCCELKKPIVDEYLNEYNSFISNRYILVQGRWKEYLNALINIVQLNPSAGNKQLVYSNVSHYFGFLMHTLQAVAREEVPAECNNTMTVQEADALIESNRDVEIECPSWFNLSFSFKFAKIGINCDAYTIEADVYGILSVGAEKKFSTGTSTLHVGAGIDGSFSDIANGEITQQFYIVFDNNNEFADIGMRGTGSGELAGGMIGAEFGYDFALNGGFTSQSEVKSGWISNYEKALGYVVRP